MVGLEAALGTDSRTGEGPKSVDGMEAAGISADEIQEYLHGVSRHNLEQAI